MLTKDLMNIGLQRRTDLAVAALRTLHDRGGKVAGSDLALSIGTTVPFLPQVLAPLVASGWVASERGPGGGYRLTVAASDVSLLDVIEATEGPADDGRCALRDAPCPGVQDCPAHAVWSAARQLITAGFSTVRILDSERDHP